MSWKNWSYWLRGGILFVVLFILLTLILGIIFAAVNQGKCTVSSGAVLLCLGCGPAIIEESFRACFMQAVPITGLLVFPAIFLFYPIFIFTNFAFNPIILILIILISLFINGAIIGFIIGKIKSLNGRKIK